MPSWRGVRGGLRKSPAEASPGEPPGDDTSTDDRHVATGRKAWLWVAMAAFFGGAGGVDLTHTQPALVQIVAGMLLSAATLGIGLRESNRPCLVWGPGGLSYRSDLRSGALQWQGLRVDIFQGTEVEISGIPWSAAVTTAGHAVERERVVIGSSRTSRRRLPWWSNTWDDLIHAITRARDAAIAAGSAQTSPPALPPAKRPSMALWVTWATLTALIVVPLSLFG